MFYHDGMFTTNAKKRARVREHPANVPDVFWLLFGTKKVTILLPCKNPNAKQEKVNAITHPNEKGISGKLLPECT